ncbi:MAG: hypothetical protein JO173_10935 [Gammaproteobacteria bacterium]|nr:hypothetical protein [Gammaproteobacteria bacterium]
MLTPAEADELIGQHLQCLPIESLPLAQCAGAVLRENIYAERDQPPFDRVAMDGVALESGAVSAGRRSFRIAATLAAGDPPLTLADTAECIEVMTGAVLPAGCDSVVPVEDLTLAEGQVALAPQAQVEPWQNVHRRGSDTRQGTLPRRRRCSCPRASVCALPRSPSRLPQAWRACASRASRCSSSSRPAMSSSSPASRCSRTRCAARTCTAS